MAGPNVRFLTSRFSNEDNPGELIVGGKFRVTKSIKTIFKLFCTMVFTVEAVTASSVCWRDETIDNLENSSVEQIIA